MLNTPNGRGKKLLLAPATVDLNNPDTLLNQLKKAGIDSRLLNIVNEFIAEKIDSKHPADQKYLINLLIEIRNILAEYIGTNLKIILMQRLIMYGLNSPRLITYYYDAFVHLHKNVKPKNRRKLFARLIKKTEVVELYRWRDDHPTLKESLQEQLYAWIKNIEREEYGFFTVRENELGPVHKLGVRPGVFMYIYRSMEEAGILERLTRREPLYKYMSQVILSHEGEKLEPKTLKNRFVYDNIKHLDAAIAYVEKMKELLEFAKKLELRR